MSTPHGEVGDAPLLDESGYGDLLGIEADVGEVLLDEHHVPRVRQLLRPLMQPELRRHERVLAAGSAEGDGEGAHARMRTFRPSGAAKSSS